MSEDAAKCGDAAVNKSVRPYRQESRKEKSGQVCDSEAVEYMTVMKQIMVLKERKKAMSDSLKIHPGRMDSNAEQIAACV